MFALGEIMPMHSVAYKNGLFEISEKNLRDQAAKQLMSKNTWPIISPHC